MTQIKQGFGINIKCFVKHDTYLLKQSLTSFIIWTTQQYQKHPIDWNHSLAI